jgi:hypothetical protein
MHTFFVWYVMAIVTLQDGKMVSSQYIHKDLESCQQAAMRLVARDHNLHWRCEEMIVETSADGTQTVKFTNHDQSD